MSIRLALLNSVASTTVITVSPSETSLTRADLLMKEVVKFLRANKLAVAPISIASDSFGPLSPVVIVGDSPIG